METRPHPLTVRISQREKQLLSEAAKQIGTSRNAFVKTACFNLVRELRAQKLIEA